MPDHNPHNTDWLALGARICQPPTREPFVIGDRVTEPKWPDVVLTVTSCIKGYVRAERRESLPDGRKVFAWSTNAPAGHFKLFARAGDNRPEPVPVVREMSALGRLEASTDGSISRAARDAANREDAERAAALLATDGERLMQAAE